MLVSTDEGVVYTLRYGGPVFAEGEELTAGDADDAEKKKDERAKKDAAKKPEGTQENRYLMVTVSFDPTLIPKPESMEPKPVDQADGAGESPRQRVCTGPQRSQVHGRAEGGRRKRPTRQGRLREEDRRRQEEGRGARRPVRPVVLRDSGRQLPLDQPGPRRAGRAQEAAGAPARSPAADFPGHAAGIPGLDRP